MKLKTLVLLFVFIVSCSSDAANYIEELETLGINEFSSEENAERYGNRICSKVEKGEITYGGNKEGLAIQYFCEEYLEDFEILTIEEIFIKRLTENDLINDYAAPRQAISVANKKCDSIDDGEDPKGNLAEKIGVEIFCPEYLDAFQILQVINVDGTFTLNSSYSQYSGYSIGGTDTNCYGTGGYGDIGPSMNIVLRNSQGITMYVGIVTSNIRTKPSQCTFEFTFFGVVEGEDVYVFEVANRGEISYSFEDLVYGIGATLGD